MLSILYGISSALAWGAADFIGGLASKRTSPYRVLFLGEASGLVPFVALALFTGETVPPLTDLLWAALANLLGLIGLVILFRALAGGQMSIAAPISALLAAIVPVTVGLSTLGIPSTPTLAGFALASLAVWLLSQNGIATDRRIGFAHLHLPLLSGLFFGFYFVIIHEATLRAFFWPLVSGRAAGVLAIGLYALFTRRPALPPRPLWGYGILNGIVDISGSALYVLAARTGRLDVAAVLGSLYPASTVLLARMLLKERVSRTQTLGILLAFAAIILLTV